MKLHQHVLDLGSSLGCPRDQLANFYKAHVILQERQLQASAAARLCDNPDGPTAIGYGGARGGGKSFWLLAQMGADDCQRMPDLKCLLLRKVGKSNLEHLEDLRRRVFRHLKHTFTANRGIITFPNGSRIVAGHFQHESDVDAYLGLEYDVIGVEEATTLTHRKYIDITTCCRSSKTDHDGCPWRPRIYSTTNPGGVGHAWYRNLFIAPFLSQRETETRFIPARVSDNSFNNPDYRRVLEGLHGWQRRAWLDGDWDIAAGQFFTNFRRDVHVISDFDDSRAQQWFAAMDYGFTHYTVALLGCKDGDGNMYVIDEHAERMWLPELHVPAIQNMLRRHGLRIEDLRRFVAGTDVFSRQANGATIADQYRKLGISLRPANTERIQGWADLLRRLGDPSRGLKPSLFIHERCHRLVDCLPNLQHDPTNPEDILKVDIDDDGRGGDDTADACRYMVHSQPATIYVRKLRGL